MNTGHAVFWGSLLGLMVLSTLGYARNRNAKQFVLYLALLAACGGIYRAVFQATSPLTSKGAHSSESNFIIILYGCMLIGIVSNYLYNLSKKSARTRRPFDLLRFLAPILASPIVFIPLLTSFQNADIDLTNLTLPKYMVFFVAFENGFFWREVVVNRRKEQTS